LSSFTVVDSSSSNQLAVIPNVGNGFYNAATDANNILLLGTGNTVSSEIVQLSTWSSTNNYVKVRPTSVGMGAGGASNTATSSVECNGTTVRITPSITFPDNSVQITAYTGGANYPIWATSVTANFGIWGSGPLANLNLNSNQASVGYYTGTISAGWTNFSVQGGRQGGIYWIVANVTVNCTLAAGPYTGCSINLVSSLSLTSGNYVLIRIYVSTYVSKGYLVDVSRYV
jgi:hypothetical protein